jgi:hypothetical protein
VFEALSGSCPVLGFGTSAVEPSESGVREFEVRNKSIVQSSMFSI